MMGANFPGSYGNMWGYGGGGHSVPVNPKPKTKTGGKSEVVLPHQPIMTVRAISDEWEPANDEQKAILEDDARRQVIPEMKVGIVGEVDWFDPKDLPKSIEKNHTNAVSDLHVKMEWEKEGERKVLHRSRDESIWQAFSVSERSIYRIKGIGDSNLQDVLALHTKGPDTIYIQRYSHDRKDLVNKVKRFMAEMGEKEEFWKYYDGMRIPNVRMDRTFEDTTLNGLHYKKDDKLLVMETAYNKIKFDMDFRGAEVRSVWVGGPGVYTCSNGVAKPEFTVHSPFLLWIHREGMELPYFIAHVTEEDWEEISW
jgi:hypothetical protein